jgi:hypothetical protein
MIASHFKCRVVTRALGSFLVVATFVGANAFGAETPQQVCNRLAGADPSAKLESTVGAEAVTACAAAVQASPENAQLVFQYARALESVGRLDEAAAMYTWASEDGLGAADAALRRLEQQPQTASKGKDNQDPGSVTRRLAGLEAMADHVAQAAARNEDDEVAVLAKTGADPAAIARWVGENTRLIPYAGTLRGAEGVLLDRVGSNLDRALLLADLLRRAGFQVRVARTTLTTDEIAALRMAFLGSAPKPLQRVSASRDEILRQLGNDPRVERALVEKSADRTIKRGEEFDAAVQNLFNRVFPGVLKAVGESDARNKQLVEQIDTSFRDHFWVQRRVAAGWEDIDLDRAIVPARQPTATFNLNSVPEELKHRVTIRVVAEMWTGGKASEHKLLEKTFNPSVLQGKAITLNNGLLPMPDLKEVMKDGAPQRAYLQALTKAWVVTPSLQIGDEIVTDQLYTLDGKVLPSGPFTLATLGVAGFANFAELNRGLTQAFGGDAANNEPKALVTAEWVEIEIGVPNETVQKYRRAVFDLIGPAARSGTLRPPQEIDARAAERRALGLSATADLFVFGATPSEDALARVTGSELADFAKDSIAAIRGAATLDDMASMSPAARLQLPLWSWALNRTRTELVPAAAPVEPNVAIYWQTIAPGSSTAETIDIVANRTLTDGDFKRGVAQGVLDTVIEHEIGSPDAPGGNTAALYGLGNGSAWQLIEPQEAERVDQLDLSDEAKARIKSDLAAGNLVLAPSAPVATEGGPQIAWWRIDPRSGTTLGIGKNGMGATAVEEPSIWHRIVAKSACAFAGIGLQIAEGPSVTSTFLMLACFRGHVAHTWGFLAAHGVLDLVLDLFANAVGPPGPGQHQHGGEPPEPPEPPGPPACQEPPPICGPDGPPGC